VFIKLKNDYLMGEPPQKPKHFAALSNGHMFWVKRPLAAGARLHAIIGGPILIYNILIKM